MLDGVVGGDPFVLTAAVAVAGVASLLVYRDAARHGSYYALSATAAVAIAGLVGAGVGGIVGLFVGTGYVLLLYLLSYPSTPTVDPETTDSRSRGDAGENLDGDDDVVSVIRVEVASYETLQELAERYDDVPNDGTESELRSKLRVKALEHVAEYVDGEEDTGEDELGDWNEPREPADDTDEPGALRQRQRDLARTESVSGDGIEEWSAEEPPAESVGEYSVDEWTTEGHGANERVCDEGVDEWTGSGFEAASEHAAESAEVESSADGSGVWSSAGEETERPETGGMVFDTAVESASDESGEASDSAEEASDGDPFDGRGELYDGDERAAEPERSRS